MGFFSLLVQMLARELGQYEVVRRQTTAGTTNSRVKPSQLLYSPNAPNSKCSNQTKPPTTHRAVVALRSSPSSKVVGNPSAGWTKHRDHHPSPPGGSLTLWGSAALCLWGTVAWDAPRVNLIRFHHPKKKKNKKRKGSSSSAWLYLTTPPFWLTFGFGVGSWSLSLVQSKGCIVSLEGG